ncbi:MAG: ABC transporter substrate-binding protein [Proteobacteria bacterium]|nr:ABC transporter substrate-binding protein [Pseudomonadota bacterium]
MPRAAIVVLIGLLLIGRASAQSWPQTLTEARGQTVYWNAWAGDEKTNAFMVWVAQQVATCCGVTLHQVPLSDTAEAVTRVIAEKTAGRDTDGTVDLIWINGPNFLALKERGLLYGPFTQRLPNFAYVDTKAPSPNLIDFTVPVDGYESPWLAARFVFIYDSAHVRDVPRDIPGFLPWVRRHPGRFTHPRIDNFLGVTFLEQALEALTPDRAALQHPATDATFAEATAPLWAWYDAVRPYLWRHGRQFPASGPAARQLLDDGEIDMMPSFNSAEAAVDVEAGLLPATARTLILEGGTLANTSFVAIPYNSPHKAGALVVANFLLAPAAQAQAADIRVLGSPTVLDLAKLAAPERARFDRLPKSPLQPPNTAWGVLLPEPHPSWATRLVTAWETRYTR